MSNGVVGDDGVVDGSEPSDPGEVAPRVLVGVDGSECSIGALRWAVRQAAAFGAVLEIWGFWKLPVDVGFGSTWSFEDMAKGPTQLVDEAVATARQLDPTVEVRSFCEEGSPAVGLVEASEGAMLLIVGSKGRGAFKQMVVGSVSHHCVLHAPCPVMVVRLHDHPRHHDPQHVSK